MAEEMEEGQSIELDLSLESEVQVPPAFDDLDPDQSPTEYKVMGGQLYVVSSGLSELPENMEHYHLVEEDHTDAIVQIEGYATTVDEMAHDSAQPVTDEEMEQFQKQNHITRISRSNKVQRDPPALVKLYTADGIQAPQVPKIKNKDIMELPFSYAGQSFNVQAQKLILNVYDFFKRNKRDPFILRRLGTPQEQASRILNVTSSVIGKIRNRFRHLGRIEVPGLKRKKVKRILDNVDIDKEEIIRDTVRELALTRTAPTVPILLAEARKRIGFVGSRTSFRRVLVRMGFKYAKVNKRTIVVDPTERHPLEPLD